MASPIVENAHVQDSWQNLKAPVFHETTSVAGVTFRRDQVAEAIKRKNPQVELVPEPENKYDSNAVRVEIGGLHVGYLPRGKGNAIVLTEPVEVLKIGMIPQPHVWLVGL